MVEWVSRALLALLAIAVGVNAQNGTLGQWTRAKLGLDGSGRSIGTASASRSGPAADVPAGVGFADPLPTGQLISVFGDPRDGGSRRHEGIDLAAPEGTTVYSVAGGVVTRAGDAGRCGLRVAIRHSGNEGAESIYCHLSRIGVAVGDAIDGPGVPIGQVGDTGNATGTTPHLHFEIRYRGTPLDPQPLIGR